MTDADLTAMRDAAIGKPTKRSLRPWMERYITWRTETDPRVSVRELQVELVDLGQSWSHESLYGVLRRINRHYRRPQPSRERAVAAQGRILAMLGDGFSLTPIAEEVGISRTRLHTYLTDGTIPSAKCPQCGRLTPIGGHTCPVLD